MSKIKKEQILKIVGAKINDSYVRVNTSSSDKRVKLIVLAVKDDLLLYNLNNLYGFITDCFIKDKYNEALLKESGYIELEVVFK
jgi:hypothetical protein